MKTFLKKYLYFRNQIYNYNEGMVLIKAFFNETFLVQDKSEILKYFFRYDVIILKWNTCA